jgi:signal transduction histidine kinase
MRTEEQANILLVDDQPGRLLTYQSVLGGLNHNLICARSGVEALEKLMQDEFAVVLLDVSMPDMDGFEAAQLIHEHPRFEQTPIIFVTGVHVSELDRLKGYKLGAVDYVSIPVVPEILRSKVAVLVELYRKRRELSELNRRLAQANEELSRANATLQAEKARELQVLNATLQQTNADLQHANRNLQSEVRERSRAEQALKEADRQKDAFLATLAHELRNPLAAVSNAVQLMRAKDVTDPRLCFSRDVIERQVAQLTRLVDDLLDVSRITTGKITLTHEPLAVTELIAQAVETVEAVMREREHVLTVAIHDRRLRVRGDRVRLTQAIANVLDNAAKYTKRGGTIALSALQQDTQVEISVQDNGIGITSEALPRVFELFAQPDREAEHFESGLGIGLALVRRLLEMHGGSVEAHSEGRGLGSRFVIRLPLHIEQAQPTSEAPVAPGDSASVRRRILVVDDNPDALHSLAALLEAFGHEVACAASGEQALELAEQTRPEVVLLDIGMPRLDGYEVARRMRLQPWGRRVLLIAVTGWGQDSDRQRSGDVGFDAHLVKPVGLEQLKQALSAPPSVAQASLWPERVRAAD